MQVIELLEKNHKKYETTTHEAAFSAQQVAAAEHVPGKTVAKPVIVIADGKYYMCVLPACYKIDTDKLRRAMGVKQMQLADEMEMAKLFKDCALGAEPPFGSLYGMTTIIDKSLEEDDEIVFQAGTHEKAVRIAMADYIELVEPKVLDFSYRLA